MVAEIKTTGATHYCEFEGLNFNIPAEILDGSFITGINLENMMIKSIIPFHKRDSTLTFQVKNAEKLVMEVNKEIDMVKSCSKEELPLLISQIRTISGIRALEEALKGI